MQKIFSPKGIELNIQGLPEASILETEPPEKIGILVDKLPGYKARLKVKQGDRVKLGGVVFEDKQRPWLQFRSPAGGYVESIDYGPRRVIRQIVVRIEQPEQSLEFERIGPQELADMDRGAIVEAIVNGGLWWAIRRLPFRDVPDPEPVPPKIFLGLAAREPFSPLVELIIKDKRDLLLFGLQVLRKLAPEVVVYAHAADQQVLRTAGDLINLVVEGNYPADDPAAVLYRSKKSAAENRSWYINVQDLLLVAELLSTGRFPTQRLFAVGGTRAPRKSHFRARLGIGLQHLLGGQSVQPGTRLIGGGILRGYELEPDGFMGFFETGLAAMPEGKEAEFLALFRPGLGKPTNSRVFLSCLRKKPFEFDCSCGGPERACISCMFCADVCPVDILPEMLYKAILADEVEEYLSHGLLDCVQCGLCSYVCPSKIELTATFERAKIDYAKQVAG